MEWVYALKQCNEHTRIYTIDRAGARLGKNVEFFSLSKKKRRTQHMYYYKHDSLFLYIKEESTGTFVLSRELMLELQK